MSKEEKKSHGTQEASQVRGRREGGKEGRITKRILIPNVVGPGRCRSAGKALCYFLTL